VAFLATALSIVFVYRDGAWLLIFVFVVPALTVSFLVLAGFSRAKRRIQLFVFLAIALCLAWFLARNFMVVRTSIRWLLESGQYKAAVLALPEPTDGTMKHVEWDAWGFAGVGDTVIYLVFNPSDSLRNASRNKLAGKFNGIPCSVRKISQMDKHWYTVFFYTDEDWKHCGPT
jgi:hypothetical protein